MSSIGGISGSNGMVMQGMHRPDPAKMAENLFAKLDTRGQGYVEKSDLQSAFDKISSSSDQSSSVDELFTKIDTNSDGKVTESEFTTTLSKLQEDLDSQFNQMRMQGHGGHGPQGMGGMPPPPPPQDDTGFTKEELSSQLEQIGSSDTERSSFISNVVNNFEAADADGDGKVSFKEAMAFDQSQQTSTTSESSSLAASTSTSSTDSSSELQVMMKIMQLMHAYAVPGQQDASSLLTVSA